MTRIRRVAALTLVLAGGLAGTAQAAGEVRIDAGPVGLTNDAQPRFEFTGTSPLECRVDTSAWQACNGGEFLTPVLTDGGHVFRVRSTANGTSAFRSFTVDTFAPQLTLDGDRRQEGHRRSPRR